MTSEAKATRGWGWPANSKKAHYFVDGRALCLRWLFFGFLQDSNDRSDDNCKTCMKRLAPMRPKAAGRAALSTEKP